jgi:hypothetical protein
MMCGSNNANPRSNISGGGVTSSIGGLQLASTSPSINHARKTSIKPFNQNSGHS